MSISRDEVDSTIGAALGEFGLSHYTDALMDVLDMGVEWDE